MQFKGRLLGHDPDSIYNSTGHRCKEINDLNFQNYMLVVGDNAGLKLDLPVEETFPYITSKALSMDYYNLCIFNGGVDALKYNLLVWLHTYPKPRTIVIACEFINSIIVSDNNFSFLKPGDLAENDVQDVLASANMCGFFQGRVSLVEKLLASVTTVPKYQIALKDKLVPFTSGVINIECDTDDQNQIATSLAMRIKHDMKQARVI